MHTIPAVCSNTRVVHTHTYFLSLRRLTDAEGQGDKKVHCKENKRIKISSSEVKNFINNGYPELQ